MLLACRSQLVLVLSVSYSATPACRSQLVLVFATLPLCAAALAHAGSIVQEEEQESVFPVLVLSVAAGLAHVGRVPKRSTRAGSEASC